MLKWVAEQCKLPILGLIRNLVGVHFLHPVGSLALKAHKSGGKVQNKQTSLSGTAPSFQLHKSDIKSECSHADFWRKSQLAEVPRAHTGSSESSVLYTFSLLSRLQRKPDYLSKDCLGRREFGEGELRLLNTKRQEAKGIWYTKTPERTWVAKDKSGPEQPKISLWGSFC